MIVDVSKEDEFDWSGCKFPVYNSHQLPLLRNIEDERLWGWVYLFELNGIYKIGATTKSVEGRLRCYSNPVQQPKLLKTKFSLQALKDERIIHKFYFLKKMKGDWFKLNSEDVKNIKERFEREEKVDYAIYDRISNPGKYCICYVCFPCQYPNFRTKPHTGCPKYEKILENDYHGG